MKCRQTDVTKAWDELRERFYRWQRERWFRVHKLRVRTVHDLEQRLRQLQAMPLKPGRTDMIAYLSRRLSTLRSSPV